MTPSEIILTIGTAILIVVIAVLVIPDIGTEFFQQSHTERITITELIADPVSRSCERIFFIMPRPGCGWIETRIRATNSTGINQEFITRSAWEINMICNFAVGGSYNATMIWNETERRWVIWGMQP